MKSETIYIILGPTSTGKTSLALELCKKYNGEIISCDSRQIYKYMNIGTGKIPVGVNINVDVNKNVQEGKGDIKKDIQKKENYWEVDGIKIWGYDLTTPDKYFSGYDYALFTLKKMEEILKEGKKVFIVGGSGFYIDLITQRVKPSNIKPNFELRSELESLNVADLKTKLMSLNPEVYSRTDLNNPVRLIRAIEREMSQKISDTPLPYLNNVEFKYIGLKSLNDFLYKRSDKWVDAIWNDGLIDEVKNLINMGFINSSKMHGLVYKSALKYLEGTLSLDEAISETKFSIHAYIRRQLTYFKKNKDIVWFDIAGGNFKQSIYNLING